MQHLQLDVAVELVRQAIRQLQICPYDEASGLGDLRYLQLTAAGSKASGWQAQHDDAASIQVLTHQQCLLLAGPAYGPDSGPVCTPVHRGPGHYEIWEHCQSTSNVQAQVLQNLRVQDTAWLRHWPMKVYKLSAR